MDIKRKLTEEFGIKPVYVSNLVDLIEEGNSIPFIARYRKEMHGGCDDEFLRNFGDRLSYLKNLEKRKEEIKNAIENQGKWTDEISAALENAATLTEAEDVYRPYKQKKKTRASIAAEKGLEPLADIMLNERNKTGSVLEIASRFVDEEKGVKTAEEAVSGAEDIIAERISDDAELRKLLRKTLFEEGEMVTEAYPKQEDKDKLAVYEMYFGRSEKIKTLPSHRILAINRGEKEECLKVELKTNSDKDISAICAKYLKESIFSDNVSKAAEDAYKRLIFPSVEREVRNELTENADEQAIKMFETNLKPLLMQPPLKDKTIIGFDPAYRTGCKIAVIDKNGNVLDHTVVFPTPPQNKKEEAKATLKALIDKYKVDVISIGNGTAGKESEIFVAELIKESSRPVTYAVVNEAGASVYSASKQGTEEFPEYDVTVRSAVSIARRLQDPLAELIKIDVKSIGVGQYQHDMPQKRLTEVLEGVVENCVNSVGVDLTTASYSLLSYVSGLNLSIAKNIVDYRKSKPFVSREQLTKVAKLGPKAFEQCAGFLRIPSSENILDNTGVHPESYPVAEKLLQKYGYSEADAVNGKIGNLKEKVYLDGLNKVAQELGTGEMTLADIIDELIKPGRDIRDSLPEVELRADLMDIKDLTAGMELWGTVRNVIDFGAFVDIGVHHDGLVHLSEISNEYLKHPSQKLKVGQRVKVKVMSVDTVKNRIALSIKALEQTTAKTSFKGNKADNANHVRRDSENLEEMLKKLQNKYNKF